MPSLRLLSRPIFFFSWRCCQPPTPLCCGTIVCRLSSHSTYPPTGRLALHVEADWLHQDIRRQPGLARPNHKTSVISCLIVLTAVPLFCYIGLPVTGVDRDVGQATGGLGPRGVGSQGLLRVRAAGQERVLQVQEREVLWAGAPIAALEKRWAQESELLVWGMYCASFCCS